MGSRAMAIDWPDGYERTPAGERKPYPHGFEVTRTEAFQSILDEISKMDGTRDVQLSFGAEQTIRDPNRPYANATFDDPGVVVRFERDGEQYAMPCDRWDNPRDNARAIALTIKAKRALTRYGVETIESEFKRMRLPEGTGVVTGDPPPHETLGVDPGASEPEVKHAYRQRVKEVHPDRGGDREAFEQVKRAKEALL